MTILWITDWFPSIKEKICLEREHFSEKKANNKISSTKMKWEFLCRIFFSPFQFFLSLYIFFEITIQERKNFCLLLVYHFSRTKKYYYDFEALFFCIFCLKIKVGFLFVCFFFDFILFLPFLVPFPPLGHIIDDDDDLNIGKGEVTTFFFHFDHLRW